MSKNGLGVSPWVVLRENGKIALLYGLGAALIGLVWWPLALIYLGYCLLSLLLFIALICPYCRCYHSRSCPDAYHLIRIAKPQKEHRFAGQFKRYIGVTFPGWFLPPVAGVYLLITSFSWPILVLFILFLSFGFGVLPYSARRVCAGCANARNCPRQARRRQAPRVADDPAFAQGEEYGGG